MSNTLGNQMSDFRFVEGKLIKHVVCVLWLVLSLRFASGCLRLLTMSTAPPRHNGVPEYWVSIRADRGGQGEGWHHCHYHLPLRNDGNHRVALKRLAGFHLKLILSRRRRMSGVSS
jgi:hypothetical protein